MEARRPMRPATRHAAPGDAQGWAVEPTYPARMARMHKPDAESHPRMSMARMLPPSLNPRQRNTVSRAATARMHQKAHSPGCRMSPASGATANERVGAVKPGSTTQRERRPGSPKSTLEVLEGAATSPGDAGQQTLSEEVPAASELGTATPAWGAESESDHPWRRRLSGPHQRGLSRAKRGFRARSPEPDLFDTATTGPNRRRKHRGGNGRCGGGCRVWRRGPLRECREHRDVVLAGISAERRWRRGRRERPSTALYGVNSPEVCAGGMECRSCGAGGGAGTAAGAGFIYREWINLSNT